jgi:hypothetical protein
MNKIREHPHQMNYFTQDQMEVKDHHYSYKKWDKQIKQTLWPLVPKQTIPTERPLPVSKF